MHEYPAVTRRSSQGCAWDSSRIFLFRLLPAYWASEVKTILITALAAGALISAALLVMESLTDHSLFWMGWEKPGISAAYLFWGAVGGSVYAGVAICWLVNAVVYGGAAFVVLSCLKLLLGLNGVARQHGTKLKPH